eukprot:GHVS01098582.1.p1 GENE.GHVS01098582.1~~GHVS01098582.1.p1  ORF type:complete len:847 (-),score=210.98 GHVS01098582.1:141-2681(-)
MCAVDYCSPLPAMDQDSTSLSVELVDASLNCILSAEDVYRLFSRYGPVAHATVCGSQATVCFGNDQDAQKALHDLDGRRLQEIGGHLVICVLPSDFDSFSSSVNEMSSSSDNLSSRPSQFSYLTGVGSEAYGMCTYSNGSSHEHEASNNSSMYCDIGGTASRSACMTAHQPLHPTTGFLSSSICADEHHNAGSSDSGSGGRVRGSSGDCGSGGFSRSGCDLLSVSCTTATSGGGSDIGGSCDGLLPTGIIIPPTTTVLPTHNTLQTSSVFSPRTLSDSQHEHLHNDASVRTTGDSETTSQLATAGGSTTNNTRSTTTSTTSGPTTPTTTAGIRGIAGSCGVEKTRDRRRGVSKVVAGGVVTIDGIVGERRGMNKNGGENKRRGGQHTLSARSGGGADFPFCPIKDVTTTTTTSSPAEALPSSPPGVGDLPGESVVRKYTIRYDIQIPHDNGFDVAKRIIGVQGYHMKRIFEQTTAKLRLRGRGSGYKEGIHQKEASEPLHLCVSCEIRQKFMLARTGVEDLLAALYRDYDAWKTERKMKPPMLKLRAFVTLIPFPNVTLQPPPRTPRFSAPTATTTATALPQQQQRLPPLPPSSSPVLNRSATSQVNRKPPPPSEVCVQQQRSRTPPIIRKSTPATTQHALLPTPTCSPLCFPSSTKPSHHNTRVLLPGSSPSSYHLPSSVDSSAHHPKSHRQSTSVVPPPPDKIPSDNNKLIHPPPPPSSHDVLLQQHEQQNFPPPPTIAPPPPPPPPKPYCCRMHDGMFDWLFQRNFTALLTVSVDGRQPLQQLRDEHGTQVSVHVLRLIQQRSAARQRRDFQVADDIRHNIIEQYGYDVKDLADGRTEVAVTP